MKGFHLVMGWKFFCFQPGSEWIFGFAGETLPCLLDLKDIRL